MSRPSTRFEQSIRFLLDNLFDIITIAVAATLVFRYTIHQPRQADTSEILIAMLAVLSLIAIGGIWDRSRRIGRIENLIELVLGNTQNSKDSLFVTDFSTSVQKEIEDKIQNSDDLLIIGNNLISVIDLNYSLLENRLNNEKIVRVVLTEPGTPASDMAALREYRPIELDVWRIQAQATLNTLGCLKADTSGKLLIRVTKTYLTHGLILADQNTNNGVIYCWSYSFKTRKGNRPKFVLRPIDNYWYGHYIEEANAIWNASEDWTLGC